MPFRQAIPSASSLIKTGVTAGISLWLASCSGDTELAEANRKLEAANARIAALEARLAGTGSTTPVTPNTSIQTLAPPPGEAAAPATDQLAEQDEVIGKQWHYNVTEDAMTGKKRFTAMVESSNTVAFGFPYGGDQRGRLTLRTDPQHGKDVIFRIERGQILCPSYEGCRVQVRFDENKPIRFEASGAADHSTDVVFIDDYTGFISRLKKAKRVRIAVNIYQNGAPAFEFDVSGFDSKKYQPNPG